MRVLLRFFIGTLAVALLTTALVAQAAAQMPLGTITGPDSPASAGVATLGDDSVFFNGDANCDGVIDSLDALAVLQFDAGLLEFDAGFMPDLFPNACFRVGPLVAPKPPPGRPEALLSWASRPSRLIRRIDKSCKQ